MLIPSNRRAERQGREGHDGAARGCRHAPRLCPEREDHPGCQRSLLHSQQRHLRVGQRRAAHVRADAQEREQSGGVSLRRERRLMVRARPPPPPPTSSAALRSSTIRNAFFGFFFYVLLRLTWLRAHHVRTTAQRDVYLFFV